MIIGYRQQVDSDDGDDVSPSPTPFGYESYDIREVSGLRLAACGPLVASFFWHIVLATVAKWSGRTRTLMSILSIVLGCAAVGIPIMFFWLAWLMHLNVEFRHFWPQFFEFRRPRHTA